MSMDLFNEYIKLTHESYNLSTSLSKQASGIMEEAAKHISHGNLNEADRLLADIKELLALSDSAKHIGDSTLVQAKAIAEEMKKEINDVSEFTCGQSDSQHDAAVPEKSKV